MMRCEILFKIFLFCTIYINSFTVSAQNSIADTSCEPAAFNAAINLYHQYLSPEPGLYDGSEYNYNTYYPFTIDEGTPFFKSNIFDTGIVFYNGVQYNKVHLLFDLVRQDLVTNDPTTIYMVRLNSERVKWFIISGHTFIRLQEDSLNSGIKKGFYDLLYNGATSVYKKNTKALIDGSSFSLGIKKYVSELNEYFIKKDNKYYRVKNRKSVLSIFSDRKREVAKFIAKNKLSFKKNKDDALIKVATYYDEINTTKATN